MEFLYILFIVVGLILGYVIAHFKDQGKINRLEEREHNQTDLAEKAGVAQKKAEGRARLAENERIELSAENRNLDEKLATQKEEMAALQKRFKDEFENLANKILEEKSKKFTEQNKENIGQLLKPLGEKMSEFQKQVEQTHKEDLEGRSALGQNLKQLHELNQQMSQDAKNLTNALKVDPKTQGNWGERILQNILERSGLKKNREYFIQEHQLTKDGRQLRPDVVLKLPDNKNYIIDSKVSLKAYEEYVSEQDESVKKRILKKHINSCRIHVKSLSSKNYQQLYGGNSPDFVLMFIPIEPAFGLALQHDKDLYYEAFDKKIIIVSPSLLLASLATIDSIWSLDRQNKNAMEIAARGGKLYDKFVSFTESLHKVGDRIRLTQESYEKAMNRLSTGRGNVIRQVEKIRKLGAKNTKTLQSELIEKAHLTNGNEEEE